MLDKTQKQRVADSIRADIQRARGLFITNVVGIPAQEAVSLRKRLRESEGKIVVARNTLFKRAAEGTVAEEFLGNLQGCNALAFAFGEAPAVAKGLVEAGNDFDVVTLKGGFLDGEELSVKEILDLALLPSREEMLATVLASMMAPLSSFVRLVEAVREKKEQNEEPSS